MTYAVTLGAGTWTCTVASTPSEIATGLLNHTSLTPMTGMFFDVGHVSSCISINMNGMHFPLDIAFMGEDLKVIDVASNVQPNEEGLACVGARYFIEVNAGELSAVSPGDQLCINGYEAPEGSSVNTVLESMIPAMMIIMFMGMISEMMEG